MRAGTLRHKIEIQSRSQAQTASGAQSNAWTFATEAMASVEPMDGREFFAAQQMGAKTPTRFRTRYISGIYPKDRIVFDGRVFDIFSVIDKDGRRRELEIVTDELVGVPE